MITALRRASAASKFAFALSLCVYAFLCPDWRILVGLILVLAALLIASGDWDRSVTAVFCVAVLGSPMLLALFLLGGVEKAATWQEGVWLGLTWLGVFYLRLFVLVFADLLVVKWTTFSNMLLSLRALGLPGKAVLFVSTLVGMLPRVFALGLHVVEVQRCRGLESKRLARPSNLLALFVPVFLIQMRRATDLALSLELRGLTAEAAGAGRRLSFGTGDGLFLLAAVLVWTAPLVSLAGWGG
jgi:energy-coupling factor transport system permease protein